MVDVSRKASDGIATNFRIAKDTQAALTVS